MFLESNLAPISIPVYRRKEHLERCIAALQSSQLAEKSILYLYSDFPREGDEEAVFALRAAISKISGFKDVVVIERSSNMGLLNVVDAIERPLRKHGSVIYLEEDIIVSPGFLEYMNAALQIYKDNPNIFSVTGYTMPCSLEVGALRVKASSIFTAWGCGLWSSKYQQFLTYSREGDPLARMRSSFILRIKLMYWHSVTQYLSYKKKCVSKKLTPDMAIGFYIWHNKLLQVFPTRSLVTNRGMDGTGWNCGATSRYDHGTMDSSSDYTFRSCFSDKEVKSEFFKIRRYHGLVLYTDIKSVAKEILPKLLVNYFRRLTSS